MYSFFIFSNKSKDSFEKIIFNKLKESVYFNENQAYKMREKLMIFYSKMILSDKSGFSEEV